MQINNFNHSIEQGKYIYEAKRNLYWNKIFLN